MFTNTNIVPLLILALFNSFVIIGFNRATSFEYKLIPGIKKFSKTKIDEGSKMILWKLRYWSLNKLGHFWSKPLMTCPTCMASVHSIYVYWLFMPFDLHSLIIYPIYILLLAGMATLVNSFA